jgi:hypothetical protein
MTEMYCTVLMINVCRAERMGKLRMGKTQSKKKGEDLRTGETGEGNWSRGRENSPYYRKRKVEKVGWEGQCVREGG